MKKHLTLFLLFIITISYSQSKWIKTGSIDFIFPNKKSYLYVDEMHHAYDTELVDTGFLLTSFAIQGDYSYLVFKKLSIGALVGYQTQSKPNLSMIKLGGILKYYMIDRDYPYLYLQLANGFTTNKKKYKSGYNIRFGFSVPFLKKEKYNLNANLFVEQTFFNFKYDSEKILGLPNEKPGDILEKSYGISFSIQF